MESLKLEKEFTVFLYESGVSAVHAWHWKMLIENSNSFSLLLFDPIRVMASPYGASRSRLSDSPHSIGLL